MEQFMPLARQLARRYRNVEDLEDLEQIAAIGLVKAIDRFDPERGRGWSVRPPRSVQELTARVDHAANALLAELGRSPTAVEIAERVESTVERVLEAMQVATARHASSLDEPRDADDPNSDGRAIAIDETGFAAAEDAMLLDGLMRELTQRERLVLTLRFREDLTRSQIGEIAGISQMHVSRMIRNALEKLQAEAKAQSARQAARAGEPR